MTISKKFNSAILAVGLAAGLAVAASPASAQSNIHLEPTQSVPVGVDAVREGSKVRVTADVPLPAGASVSGKLTLGKRVLCRMAKTKQVTEAVPTRVSCTFPARYLKVKKSAKSSQTKPTKPTLTQQQYAKLALSIVLVAFDETHPPIVLFIPLAMWTLVATSGA